MTLNLDRDSKERLIACVLHMVKCNNMIYVEDFVDLS